MKYSIFDIANWFLNKESMSQKKLQKLCYYAKAWSLVLLDDVSFDFSFQAWVHGPVNTNLWDMFKRYGYLDIESDALKSVAQKIDSKVEKFLERVWDTYGEYTGFQLEALTHTEKPWINARSGYSDLEISREIIKNDDMRSYYSSIYTGDGIGE